MENKIDRIVSVLQELKTASMSCTSADDCVNNVMHKYGMPFLGDKMNQINTIELWNALNKTFEIKVELSELNNIIPSICDSLGMACEPLKAINDDSAPIPAAYRITLY